MPTELTILAWSIVLLLVHVMLQGGLATLDLGLDYNASPRDEDKKPDSVYARRAGRALTNFLETFPAFVALALALAVSNKTGGWGALGAQVWFWARIAYAPLYLFGIPYARTLAWLASLVGLLMMFARLLG